ncbi:ATP-dependent zinc protease family protein [Gilvimarinus algae]|uniref:RimK/LysX family protein n=1 Tax=Gilvimarinus algae TaxID=3058037 RepID=A0ABT8TC75_9GAMM|nr:RimK/LysX family protein [Gilvimarinus sp. SDUM040014]MDO3381695.1 RimK/LysX family protein [Gilvimarinus sp. SDUM040014]
MKLAARFALCALPVLMAGCAGQYRLVETSDLETVNQCAMASDHNHQLLLTQQRDLSQGFAELLAELEQTRSQVAKAEAANCPDVTFIAPPPKDNSTEPVMDQVAKQLVGATEQVYFDDLALSLEARIDTGISTAILPVRDIQRFERNGEDWVRFSLSADSEDDSAFERKMIRQSSVASEGQRPVIALRFTLGRITQQGEFVLADRKQSAPSVRLGRLALRDVMVVDVSRDNIASLPDPEQASEK